MLNVSVDAVHPEIYTRWLNIMRSASTYLLTHQLRRLLAAPSVTPALQPSTVAPAHVRARLSQFQPARCYKQSGVSGPEIHRPSDARWWGGDPGDLATLSALVRHANHGPHLQRKQQTSPGPSDKVSVSGPA